MSAIRESEILEALKVVTDPDLGRDIVGLGFVKNLAIDDGRVSFTIELTTPACPVKDQMRDQGQAAVSQVGGVTSVDVEMTASVRSAVAPDSGRAPIPGIWRACRHHRWGRVRPERADHARAGHAARQRGQADRAGRETWDPRRLDGVPGR